MSLLAAIASAIVVSVLLAAGTRAGWFSSARNFEGRTVGVAGTALFAGVLIGLALCVTDGIPGAAVMCVAVLGFGTLGALDDRFGDRSATGFRGHLRAAATGRFTTGFWKIVGGGATAFLCAWMLSGAGRGWSLVLQTLLIALAANTWNLLDTRPVRASAAFLLVSFPLALVVSAAPLWVIITGVLAFLPWDRRRIVMLGDAGANLLGAAWAVAFAASVGVTATAFAVAVFIALNVYTERHSLNAAIAARPWLARLDVSLRGATPDKERTA